VSCLLFNLAIEPLATALRASTLHGIVIPGGTERLITTLFADDTTVYLSVHDDYSTLTGILERWCDASRAKFNTSKTEHIPIGSPTTRLAFAETRTAPGSVLLLPPAAKVAADGQSVRILGAWVGNNLDLCAAWRPIIETVRVNLTRWNARKPTLYGRKLIIALEVGSRTQFLAMAQGMPPAIERELIQLTATFLNGMTSTRSPVSRDIMYTAIADGGLNLLDLASRNRAIELMLLKAYLNIHPSRP
ncbi:hypothetical protein FKP32DRAFT_1533105, partial [Trametes sanguinea]